MPLSDNMLKQLMATFRKELEEHLNSLNKGLLALERNPSGDERDTLLTHIFRAAHSLKGASRAVDLRDIEAIAHRMEDALDKIRKENKPFTGNYVDIFLDGLDAIGAAMAAHTSGDRLPPARLNLLLGRLNEVITDAGDASTTTTTPQSPPATPQSPPATPPSIPDRTEPSVPPVPQPEASTAHAITTPTPPHYPAISDDTIRVTTTKLDSLMGGLGELTVVRMRADQLADQIKSLQQRAVSWQKRWGKVRPHYSRVRKHGAGNQEPGLLRVFDFLESNELEIKRITADLNALISILKNDRNYLNLVTEELQSTIRQVRMLPLATLFDLFPRMVRDLARDFGKEIVLEMAGEETEVDRQVLELIKDPMVHIVRNAVDHAIEMSGERVSLGKRRHGTIRISAEQRSNNLVLTVSDDGRGIDLEAVRRSAVERGLIQSEKVSTLTDRETTELIFASGVTTSRQVTDISGRGVGMNVVRANMEQMRGLTLVDSRPGIGTTFTLTVPLMLATSHVLLVRAAQQTLAVPMMNVERMLRISTDKVKSIEGFPTIHADGHALPLISLRHVLQMGGGDQSLLASSRIPVVLVSAAGKRVALRVEALLSVQQVVIKSLGKQLRRVRNVGGVTILGDGRLVPVLNVADIMRSIHGKSLSSAAIPFVTVEPKRRQVLVVDDSITTRTLEKHILENAGYEVTTLVDGQEAWELIYGNEKSLPGLVVSDIDMPRMSGFDLTRAIKDDNRFNHIPVILVTSLDSAEDRLNGMEAGADAYIVKSTFDQKELLEAIERLMP